ncbi:hypothetical protein [Pseudonocardia sp. TRM90224]|uniref:hypothetical protein n=1 Tax=Pseudonocardia sp. TRM90224 TaxID=2812678 RepID=UPI001E40B7CF|nr:hypothetical protein [Pseudonocardia sp. TRM90224]
MKAARWRRTGVVLSAVAVAALMLASAGPAAAQPPAPPDGSSAVAPDDPADRGGQKALPMPPADAEIPWVAPPASDLAKEPPSESHAAAADPNRYVARYGPITVPNGEWYAVWTYCPGGFVAAGGGGYNSSSGGVYMTGSRPTTFQGDGWEVSVRNLSGAGAGVTVYAVCVQAGAVSGYEVSDFSTYPESGQVTETTATCASNRAVLGGGFDSSNGLVQVSGTWPYRIGVQHWVANARNLAADPIEIRSYAMCANAPRYHNVTTGEAEPINGYAQATVTCPEGTVALGGGATSTVGDAVTITDSYPVGDRGWGVFGRTSAERQTISALAVCVEF